MANPVARQQDRLHGIDLAHAAAGAGAASAVWLGVMLCLYSLHDFSTDLWLYAQHTDAGILAAYWGQAWLAYPIAALWEWLSVWVMYRAMGMLVKQERD